MTNNNNNNPVSSSLEDLKRRLTQAQPVVVTPTGQVVTPNDPQAQKLADNQKTVVKPSRWF